MLVNGKTAIERFSLEASTVAVTAGRGCCGDPVVSLKARTGLAMFLSCSSPRSSAAKVELPGKLVVHLGGYAYAAGIGQRFKPRRYVDAVSKDVGALADDVAEIDADPQDDLGGGGLVGFRETRLQGQRRVDGGERAGEFHQHPVAHKLHDPPAVPVDDRFQDLLTPFSKGRERSGLVRSDEA
jgi:hypothetical protein